MIRFMANLSNKFSGVTRDEGQTIVEYALIIAIFSVAMVASLSLFQGGLSGYMQNIVDQLAAAFSR